LDTHQRARKTLDEVTGIEGISYRSQFVPGLDFLGGSLLGSIFLAGVSLLVPNKQNQTQHN
jgi:hypothetical protein